jgi:hypothetical protein
MQKMVQVDIVEATRIIGAVQVTRKARQVVDGLSPLRADHLRLYDCRRIRVGRTDILGTNEIVRAEGQ